MIKEDIKVNNFYTYKDYMTKLFGEDKVLKLFKELGGDDRIMNASFGMDTDSGCAYEGSLIEMVLNMGMKCTELCKNEPIFNDKIRRSAWRVILLQHIAKVVRFDKSTEKWKIERGQIYEFNNSMSWMRDGECAIYYTQSSGIVLSEEEYRAIRLLDKIKDKEPITFNNIEDAVAFCVKFANEIVIFNKRLEKN